MMATVKSRPFDAAKLKLRVLKYDVEDGRFLRIFRDIGRSIGRSEKACEKAAKQINQDHEDTLVDAECDYLEELIGASFIVLQTKIRRVTSAALAFHKALKADHQVDIQELCSPDQIRKLGGTYKSTQASLVQLIWDIGNYYKHRDEWSAEVWRERRASERKDSRLDRDRNTRRSVQRVGIVHISTGNMRKAYEFFDIGPYSQCEQLAEMVQKWADRIYKTVQLRLRQKRQQ
jgi:hypothetical protein